MQHLELVQGNKVKQWNRNNSTVDCLIAFKFKFGTEFHHVTVDTLQMFKEGHRIFAGSLFCRV